MLRLFLIALIILFLSACSDHSVVVENRWKFGKGYHIGDMITFEALSNDTLYTNGNAVALIKNLEGRGVDHVLTIRSIETNEIGFYFSK